VRKILFFLITFSVCASVRAQTPTLFIIGDSTVKNSGANVQGWGDPIADLFDQSKIKVVNRARGGRSSRTFQSEGLWDQVRAEMKRGDFLLMQFGHNDGGPVNDESRARGSLPGTGNEIEEISNRVTKQYEIVHTYGWYMRKYVKDAKAKGVTVIVVSQVPRNIWIEGKVERIADTFGGWAESSARSEGAFFIDLNEIVARKYESIGPEKISKDYFFGDHTHTSPTGALLNAQSVVEGLRALRKCPRHLLEIISLCVSAVNRRGTAQQSRNQTGERCQVMSWFVLHPGGVRCL
jgi:rhamnogalacturonan acetylesterase